jgi:hypothetical protein
MIQCQCLCGAVRFRLEPPLRDVSVCHCSICRTLHGGAAAYSAVSADRLHLDAGDAVRDYEVAGATYSFCGRCGSQLFWRRPELGHVSFNAALIAEPTGIVTSHHIFVGSAGDYEDVSTSLPTFERYSTGT